MATVTIKHASLTGAAANPNVLVDGPKWDASHTVTGLENVDNTSDVNKPISTATQTALDAKITGTPAALTKVNDTNVTMTLGGTPATALLQATSVTLGWTGTLAEARGGTGKASYAVGDLLYADTTTTLARLADVATGNALISGGTGTAPAWGKIGLSTHISGFGTGIATALAINTGSAGAPVLFNGVLGTPSSGTLTSCTAFTLTTTGSSGAATYSAGTLNIPQYSGSGTPGQIAGTTTNDNASAGNVGEYKFAGTPAGGIQTTTVTITNASPGVVTWTAHGFLDYSPVYFTTTGALPTGLTASTGYYVVPGSQTANTFQVSATVGGAAINTSSAGSGTHTGFNAFPTSNAGTTQNVTALSLTAGDWDVTAMGLASGATTTNVTYVLFGLTTTSATLDTSGGRETIYPKIATPFSGGGVITLPIASARFSLASTTTVYMVINTVFDTSTMSTYGCLHARRVR